MFIKLIHYTIPNQLRMKEDNINNILMSYESNNFDYKLLYFLKDSLNNLTDFTEFELDDNLKKEAEISDEF